MFLLLSTRFVPAAAFVIPFFQLFGILNFKDTYHGLLIFYVMFSVPFSVWILKGFIDGVSQRFDETGLVNGASRAHVIFKVVLPQAITGIASTAIFCLIFAWNEYAFAVLLTSGDAQTAPPFIPTIIGVSGKDWPAVAAGATLFLVPVMVFTVLLRKHLLRGITFGAIRK